jgi:menaquinol-cytochrome c reductase iron-sulfur subunit
MPNRRTLVGALVAGGAAIASGVVAIPALLAGMSPIFQSRRRQTWRSVGPLAGFSIGEVKQATISTDRARWPRTFREQAVFVWRSSASEVVVFSRSCTDLGCPLKYDAGSTCFFCPCHGGVFAQDGERLAGPPNGPMFRYTHRVREGILEIDPGSVPIGA